MRATHVDNAMMSLPRVCSFGSNSLVVPTVVGQDCPVVRRGKLDLVFVRSTASIRSVRGENVMAEPNKHLSQKRVDVFIKVESKA
jgi:hypothetical protein